MAQDINPLSLWSVTNYSLPGMTGYKSTLAKLFVPSHQEERVLAVLDVNARNKTLQVVGYGAGASGEAVVFTVAMWEYMRQMRIITCRESACVTHAQ